MIVARARLFAQLVSGEVHATATVTLSLPAVWATGRAGVKASAHAVADWPGLSEGVVRILGWHDNLARKSFVAGFPETVAVTAAGEPAIVALPAFVTVKRIGWTASFCPRLYVTPLGCAFVRGRILPRAL